jgi:uncharacterized membrane protein
LIQSLNGPPAGEGLYALLSNICHQYPTRSFWLSERPMGLCVRCFAGYSGISLGAILLLAGLRLPRAMLVGLAFFLLGVSEPIVAIATSYEGSAVTRLASGLVGGLGVFLLLCPLPQRAVSRPSGGSNFVNKTIALGVVALMVIASATAEAREVRLRNGTVVVVKTQETLTSNEVRAGDEVVLVVASPVVVDGATVIEAGTPVIGFVDEAEESDMAGKPGEIRISLRLVTAVDGTNVTLSGNMVGKGEDQIGRNVAIGVILCPFVLLDKGGPGVIGAGREVRALTIGDFDIEVPD